MRPSLVVVILTAAGALAISTTAAPFTDQAPGMDGVTLTPADGPNSIYAVEHDDELAIQITEDREQLAADGVSHGSVTVIHNIFQIRYAGPGAARVWIETNTDDVQFQASNYDVPIEGEQHNLTLASGTSISVGLIIDTTGDHDVENLTEFTVAAALPEDTDTSNSIGDRPDEGTDPGDGETDPGDKSGNNTEDDSGAPPGESDDTEVGEVGDSDSPEQPDQDGIEDGERNANDDRTGIGEEITVVSGSDDTSGLIDTGDGLRITDPEQTLGGFVSQILLLIVTILAGAGAFTGLRRIAERTK